MRALPLVLLALALTLPALAPAAPAAGPAPSPERVVAGHLGVLDRLDEATARAFLESRGLAGVDLVYEGVREGLALRSARFHQTTAGLPVEGTRAQVTVDEDHVVRWMIADVERDVAANPCWSREAPSVAAARARLPGETWGAVRATHLVNHLGDTVWRVRVPLLEPFGAWEADVSCAGDVLRVVNAARGYEEGPAAKIFPVSPIVASQDPDFRDNPAGVGAGMEGLLVDVEILGLDGFSFTGGPAGLHGEYAYIVGGLARNSGSGFVYDRGDPRFEEVNAYFYVDWSQRHIQSLGFDHVHNHTATIVPRLPGGYTAFYTGDPLAEIWFGYKGPAATLMYGVDHIVVGKGGLADSAEDAHVILHEYGHAVLDYQAGICCTEESGAMHEAFGDWMAASFLTRWNEGVADGCMAPWFGSYLNEATTGEFPCYRNLVNDMTMADWVPGDDAHFNQLIWSGALWKTESALMERDGREAGAAAFERLMLEANFLLPAEVAMKDNVQALLVADAAQNGGANRDLLAAEFLARGIVAETDLPTLDDLVGGGAPVGLGEQEGLAVPAPGVAAVLGLAAVALALRRKA